MHIIVFGFGYSGERIARLGCDHGAHVTATTRDAARAGPHDGIDLVAFGAAGDAIAAATHVVSTVAPDDDGDPVLRAHGAALANAPGLRWIGYMSATGVYGDREGGWVDETTAVAPGSPRAQRRVAAERAWTAFASRVPVDLFRTAGIYGPGRSVFDDLRAGRARRVHKPGQAFSRIHRDDIAGAVLAAARQERPPSVRVLHLADNEAAESAAVTAEAAELLGLPAPPLQDFAEIEALMSPMARSFWSENRRVSTAWTQQALGRRWLYPTFREGLRAILAEERGAEERGAGERGAEERRNGAGHEVEVRRT
jgi:nucleoside-diphosphate-sugar epimerase